ncbi:hypothetical protein [Streptomyces sp. NBC_01500]|uniref:hypothetical protein n=1 Tax=Streptomyces sp. NBC_01500 TaxID=2903886 RepID=UPI0022550537|nr:hypothetical protein [Streptomyces sp. NBC_01500]MCX4554208.1 hypothetical protein [Streptomyces sp. NBC_01500]
MMFVPNGETQALGVFQALRAALGTGLHSFTIAGMDLDGSLIVTQIVGPAGPVPGAVLTEVAVDLSRCLTFGGGVVSRSFSEEGSEIVRGWRAVGDGVLQPLTAGEVFDSFCINPNTGDPVSPELGVEYAAGIDLYDGSGGEVSPSH